MLPVCIHLQSVHFELVTKFKTKFHDSMTVDPMAAIDSDDEGGGATALRLSDGRFERRRQDTLHEQRRLSIGAAAETN